MTVRARRWCTCPPRERVRNGADPDRCYRCTEPSEMTTNPPDNWRTQAACRGMDVGMFVPDCRGEGQLLYVQVRQVCARCPVSDACLEYALTHHEEWGMWGGTTPAERAELGYRGVMVGCRICGVRFRTDDSRARYCGDDCRGERKHRTA